MTKTYLCTLGAILLALIAIGVFHDVSQKSVVLGDFFVEDYARADLEALIDAKKFPYVNARFVKNGPILRISVYGSSKGEALSRFDNTVDSLKTWGRKRATREAGESTNHWAIRGPYVLDDPEEN